MVDTNQGYKHTQKKRGNKIRQTDEQKGRPWWCDRIKDDVTSNKVD